MRKTRVLLAGLPKLMTDLLRHLIARDSGVAVVGQVGMDNILGEARRARADVIVIKQEAPDEYERFHALMYGRPRLRIVSLADDGAKGAIYELRPHRVRLGDLSVESLARIIAATPPSRVQSKRKSDAAR